MKALRRALLAALAAGPLLARAAPAGRRKRLAIMHFEPVSDWKEWTVPFVAALAQHGFVDGRNVDILLEGIVPGSGGGPEPVAERVAGRLPAIAPDVIVTDGPITTLILRLATRTVPIVTHVSDPVGAGHAASLARPGGNVTGLSDGVEETSVKIAELVKRLVPAANRLAVVHDPRPASAAFAANFLRAAGMAGLEPVPVAGRDDGERWAGLRKLPSKPALACLWAWFDHHPRTIAAEALAMRLPLFAPDHDLVRFGFLAAYSGHEPAPQARLAAIAAQVLRGASPGSIPFQLPQHFRMALNRKTAAALGITVPADLLLRADKVIE